MRSKHSTSTKPFAAWTCAALLLAGCGERDVLGPVADARSAEAIREVLATAAEATGSVAAGPVGTGWATLRGRIVFEGDPPTMPPFNVTSDHAVCAPGGQAPKQETLVVDSATSGIKHVAVYLRGASRVHDSAQPREESALFDQKMCVFLSHVLPVMVGQPVEVRNSDPVGHNTNIIGSGFNPIVPAGESTIFTPQREAALPLQVKCSIHPWMEAFLLPRRDGYAAVTVDDGSFEIANVPAGEPLEFQVWHESATGAGGALVATSPEARAIGWNNRGRFTLTLAEDEVKEIEITVPATAFRL